MKISSAGSLDRFVAPASRRVPIDRHPRRMGIRSVDCPASQQRARKVVFIDLVAACGVVHDPERRAVSDYTLAVRIAAVQSETAGRVLASREPAGGAGIPVDR